MGLGWPIGFAASFLLYSAYIVAYGSMYLPKAGYLRALILLIFLHVQSMLYNYWGLFSEELFAYVSYEAGCPLCAFKLSSL